MLQPIRWALTLALVWSVAPRAEAAAPGRIRRERVVAVAASAPLPEVRVDKATATLLLFPAALAKNTLTVDGQPRAVDGVVPPGASRIRVVDVGERSIIVQAVEDLPPGERHELAVFFADGRAPARAAFLLVTDPAEVDARLDVERPPPSAACPAEAPRPMPRPEDFVLLGYVDTEGVQVERVEATLDVGQGLSASQGFAYRGKGWVVVDVRLENLAGRQPWTPHEATLTDGRGTLLPARLVTENNGAPVSGKWSRVLAVAAPPAPGAGDVFVLRLRGDGGRGLAIPGVRLQGQATEVQKR